MQGKFKLVKDTMIIAIGKFSTQILSFLLLPLYTSFLTTEQYGTYDFIIALVSFISPFITLTLEESIFRFLIDSKSTRKKKYIISQAIMYILFSTLIFSIIIKVIGEIYNYEYTNILIVYTISVVFISLTNSIVRGMEQIKLFSISNLILGIITIIFNILFIAVLRTGASGLLLSTSIANTSVSIFLFIKLKLNRFINIKNIEKNILKSMIKYSIPLIPNSLSWNIINLSDRLVIISTIGEGANGIYSIANKFPTIITTFYGFFNIAWLEKASKTVKKDNTNEYYSYVYKNIKTLLISTCILIIAFMPIVFPILINNEYLDAYNYIPILVMGTFFTNMSSFYGGIFIAYKDTKIIGKTTIISAILNLIINIGLIRHIGLYAAAISTCISAFIVYVCRKIIIKKYIKINETRKIWIYYLMLITVMISYYLSNSIVSLVIGFICFLICIFDNKELLLSLLKELRKNKN